MIGTIKIEYWVQHKVTKETQRSGFYFCNEDRLENLIETQSKLLKEKFGNKNKNQRLYEFLRTAYGGEYRFTRKFHKSG